MTLGREVRERSASRSPAATIGRELASGAIIPLDGPIGTELERRGAAMHGDVWCAMATVDDALTLRGIHEDYIRAGARVVTANTFSSHRLMLDPAGLGHRFLELNRRAVEVAMEARDRLGAAETVAIAGSMSHQVPFHPGTDLRDQRQIPAPAVYEAGFRELANTLAGLGVDLLLLEMMSDPALVNAAVAAARETGLPIWLGYACRASPAGVPVSFTREELGLRELMQRTRAERADVVGIMHTGVAIITPALQAMRGACDRPLMAYPDTGHFEMPCWRFDDAISPSAFTELAGRWVDEGASLIGGCCGFGVEHISALTEALARRGS